jgi:hypothetical protein
VSLQTIGSEDRMLVRVGRPPGGEMALSAAAESPKAAVREIDPPAQRMSDEVAAMRLAVDSARHSLVLIMGDVSDSYRLSHDW